MKKNKLNKLILLIIIAILIIVSLLIFILNFTKDNSSLTLLEKKWVNDNSSNIIDVSVYNDIPIYGELGEGIIFDFLENFTKSYDIDFNKISYLTDSGEKLQDISFKVLGNSESISGNDILMYEDQYVLLSKDKNITSKSINGSKIGLLSEDIKDVSQYLSNFEGISYTPFDSEEELLSSLGNDVDFIAVAQNQTMKSILENDLNVVYYISDMHKKYVLEVNNNKTLYKIMKKYYEVYSSENLLEDYKTNFLKTVFNYKNIEEVDKATYNSSSYTYGYVTNMPYENSASNKFIGTISNYLQTFEDLASVNIKTKKYKSINKLKEALEKGDIDFALCYYNLSDINTSLYQTNFITEEKFDIISSNPFIINSVKSLESKKVSTVSNTNISNYLSKEKVRITTYNDTDELLRNTSSDSIIALDHATYEYYAHNKFSNYKILYQQTLDDNYSFIIRDTEENETFKTLFNYYIQTINYKSWAYEYNTNYLSKGILEVKNILKSITLVVIIILLITLSIILSKRFKHKKGVKEDKFKFIDVMTSLKNRNYLNYNIQKWEDNVIYPQAVIIIDLNNIKYINDSRGHKEGDTVIKKAANTLIINQLENSDIIRSDGNEFLIYMVGYKEEFVIEYIHRLNKALKDIPYGFGAAIGYSMINDDIKTIDDAINEATIAMRGVKEKSQ